MTDALVPAGGSLQLLTFRVGAHLFALPLKQVREVTLPPPVTRVPHAPPLVGGYVNLRGTVHLALDPRRLLGQPPPADPAAQRLVLLATPGDDPYGILVDAIGDIEELPAHRIEPPGASLVELPGERLLSGVGRRDGELCLILDAARLLPLVASAPDH